MFRLTRTDTGHPFGLHPAMIVAGVFLLAYPWFASDFFVFQIGAYSLILGTIGLSLMMLAGYGGMVSLAQLTVAGVAGYMMAILGENSMGVMGLGWPWWLTVIASILTAALFSAFIGAIAVRTEGIYTIMITLAIAVAFFYFVRQNYALFNGFTGYAGIEPPTLLGVYWRDATPFYYLTLVVSGFFFFAVTYGARSTFGLSLQAIRDNPRRMRALGYDVTLHRVAAYFLSGLIAGTAGVLLVWFNGRISPGSVGIDVAIDILVIAVVGGMRRPIGPYLGAIAFVLLENFAIDLIDRERFNTVIGLAFLLVVLFSPDGLLGLWNRFKTKIRLPHAVSTKDGRETRGDRNSPGSLEQSP
ncbi:branched-chain amino acid ABC transporter permease [Rhodospirillaceae bacterium KN72]|uniref:Branched-chain amino acid ABC transporter permease n=1 Tax=Pacificispira spongiicola TaxID=2729598 RepID=A0A7Y0HFW1_9PROT|nr:branched-chain amino acid ABC transporter permease [Pacificispira spongiicola]NMM43704.1 branched-chain amino acid ABC transporter permease [Pacificispira spongiicola]